MVNLSEATGWQSLATRNIGNGNANLEEAGGSSASNNNYQAGDYMAGDYMAGDYMAGKATRPAKGQKPNGVTPQFSSSQPGVSNKDEIAREIYKAAPA